MCSYILYQIYFNVNDFINTYQLKIFMCYYIYASLLLGYNELPFNLDDISKLTNDLFLYYKPINYAIVYVM